MKNEELIELFVNTIKLGRECEVLKQLINDHADFEPYAVFTRIDRFEKGSFNEEDIKNFLKDNNFFPHTKDKKGISLFFEYYDRDFDGKLSFDEFLLFVLNKSHSLLRAISTQKKTFKVLHDEYLPNDLEEMIMNLLLKEFHLFEYVDKKKLEIFFEKFSIIEVFVELDGNKDGYIDMDDIDSFLRKKKVVLYREEIQTLISLYDEDLDGKLNWNEFLFLILPSKQSYNYDYSWLREMEMQHMEIYYDSIRREKLKKESKLSDISHSQYNNSNNRSLINEENHIEIENHVNSVTNNIFDNQILYDKYINHQEHKSEEPSNLGNNFNYSDTITREYTPEPDYSRIPTHEQFSTNLYNLMEIDKNIEALKIQLSCKKSFNLITTFKFFDREKKDHISFDNFVSALEYFNVITFPNGIKEAELLFRKYDSHYHGKINYSQFIELFIPKTTEQAILLTKRKPFSKEIYFETDVKLIMTELLTLHLQAEIFIFEIRQRFSNNQKELRDIFDFLDNDGNGFLTLNEFKNTFNRYNMYTSYQDLLLIMDRFDKNKDGKISLTEFFEEFTI